MNRQNLIRKSYQEFGKFRKPDRSTVYKDSPIDQDHEKVLKDIKRRDLSIEIIGTSTWSPISYLNEEATAYYMPRLVELALLNVDDIDGEPFINRFVNYFFSGPENDERFALFEKNHKELIKEVFLFLKLNYNALLELEGWNEEVELAIKNWSSA